MFCLGGSSLLTEMLHILTRSRIAGKTLSCIERADSSLAMITWLHRSIYLQPTTTQWAYLRYREKRVQSPRYTLVDSNRGMGRLKSKIGNRSVDFPRHRNNVRANQPIITYELSRGQRRDGRGPFIVLLRLLWGELNKFRAPGHHDIMS